MSATAGHSSLDLGRPLSFHRQSPATHQSAHPATAEAHPEAVHSAIGEYNEALRNAEDGPPERNSSSSSRTIADDEPHHGDHGDLTHEELRRRRSEELGGPSKKRLTQAAMAGTIAGKQGSAGGEALLGGVSQRPRGWQETEWDDKHGFWSPELKKERHAAFKKGAFVYIFITCWLWICLSIFWGSTYKLEENLKNLRVDFVTFDNGADANIINQPMLQAVQQQQQLGSTPHLGWVIRNANEYPDGLESIRRDIIGQEAWATVVVNANATSAWRQALQNGNGNYDPTGAVAVYYESARFYQVTLLYLNAMLVQFLETPLQEARQNALQQFTTGGVDAAALSRAASVPQAIGTAFGYTIQDLRSIPNYAWSSAAPMEASLIYFVIFAFYVAFYGAIARMKTGLASKLKLGSFFGIRILWPLVAYFFLSLWQTCIVQAFQVPLYDYLGRAGFVVFWALNFVTIVAGGFAMETVISIFGPQWLPVFLVLWLIMNITSSFFPLELMPRFYQFFQWGIFMHNVEGFKIIAFGTDFVHRLGYHFGIIFAVIGVECIGYPLAVFFERWKMDRGVKRAKAEKARKEKSEAKEGA